MSNSTICLVSNVQTVKEVGERSELRTQTTFLLERPRKTTNTCIGEKLNMIHQDLLHTTLKASVTLDQLVT